MRFKSFIRRDTWRFSPATQPEHATHHGGFRAGCLLNCVELELAFFHRDDRLQVTRDAIRDFRPVQGLRVFHFPFIDTHAVSIRFEFFGPLAFAIAEIVVGIAIQDLARVFAGHELVDPDAIIVKHFDRSLSGLRQQ